MKKNDRYSEAQKEIGKVLKKKGSVTFEDFLAQYGDYPINPHLHTTKQLNKMTKKGLIRFVVKLEKFIVKVAYQMYKSKLPRLKTIKQKALPKRKTKTKKTVGKIYHTKNGQPYKILASGKARFVKK